MKPFIASKFISNQETPVVSRHGKPIEILSITGRQPKIVVGYMDKNTTGSDWMFGDWYYNGRELNDVTTDWDLFFAPKIEVVHVFLNTESGKTEATIREDQTAHWKTYGSFTCLGTITGPIVPPEKSEVEK